MEDGEIDWDALGSYSYADPWSPDVPNAFGPNLPPQDPLQNPNDQHDHHQHGEQFDWDDLPDDADPIQKANMGAGKARCVCMTLHC